MRVAKVDCHQPIMVALFPAGCAYAKRIRFLLCFILLFFSVFCMRYSRSPISYWNRLTKPSPNWMLQIVMGDLQAACVVGKVIAWDSPNSP